MMAEHGLHGSYAAEDVTFLLKLVDMPYVGVDEKETLIQSGGRHYSEMISKEKPPSDAYLRLFNDAFERNKTRVARDVVALARALEAQHPSGLVLASLARAGTPIGILLKRQLSRMGVDCAHYSISIIRDRGVDERALLEIQRRHPDWPIWFVDGWTGKGAISGELKRSLALFNRPGRPYIEARMAVLSDLAGTAELAASGDDYLIPSSILNGIVSGLLSRTILNHRYIGPTDYHGCVYLAHLAPLDISRWYVDTIDQLCKTQRAAPAVWTRSTRELRYEQTQVFLQAMMYRYACRDLNRIKPGVGEATRALLRRLPDRVLLRDPSHVDVRHIVLLATEKGVAIDIDSELPYAAVTLIKKLGA
ncbi:MAG: cysteine protease StiP family protein [Bradymonadia bacterium]